MEHKIGEIFEYNGEWYQCVDWDVNPCSKCDFDGKGICSDEFPCTSSQRKDKKYVFFKKLEKVGETYEKRVSDGTFSTFQRYKVYNSVILPKKPYMYCNFIDNTIEIEIKQTKEDMEEKKFCEETSKANEVNMIFKIASKYINGGITYDEFGEAMRNWINGSEKDEHILKEFDLEAAKLGKPVCTRDGRKARIICFDRRLFYKNVSYPILALVECSDGEDDVCGYNEKGKLLIEDGAEYKDDLMMLPEKKEGWVNVYKVGARLETGGNVHSTKDAAIKCIDSDKKHISTVKIEWEE